MDEILTTARDLELEVNEDVIEELIMGHEDELTTEELQEILNEEHQETQRNVSPEQKEDERGPIPTSAIKDLLKKWEDVRAIVVEWHPNQPYVTNVKHFFHLGSDYISQFPPHYGSDFRRRREQSRKNNSADTEFHPVTDHEKERVLYQDVGSYFVIRPVLCGTGASSEELMNDATSS
ncbi:uncharacterized protein TNCT_375641 [Trichonephila clavata]|uniref:Uncharacterized protein n=1 Tax=Trichonephila clavata TaxID=2740835 RepID=A0A8X6FWP2_TRICU|nr:uncharacterized protein TNCT_375641 [Trichonephila clavata]